MSAAAVVYVHGLWMQGGEGRLLEQRLVQQYGYRWLTFRYDSVRESMSSIVERLRDDIDTLDASHVHLLGHSLGGLVIQRLLARFPVARPGRVVFMGTPAHGSAAARLVGSWRWGPRLLGRPLVEELLEGLPPERWSAGRELGLIAGTLPLGFGQLLLKFDEPNDGTVALSETQLVGSTGALTLPVSHMGLLWSARAARQVGYFFEHGRFEH